MTNIDWTKLVTKEMKEETTKKEKLANIGLEISNLRKRADYFIVPLQDAVDLDEASDNDLAKLKLWKKYRIALSKVVDQKEYPNSIDWPIAPE